MSQLQARLMAPRNPPALPSATQPSCSSNQSSRLAVLSSDSEASQACSNGCETDKTQVCPTAASNVGSQPGATGQKITLQPRATELVLAAVMKSAATSVTAQSTNQQHSVNPQLQAYSYFPSGIVLSPQSSDHSHLRAQLAKQPLQHQQLYITSPGPNQGPTSGMGTMFNLRSADTAPVPTQSPSSRQKSSIARDRVPDNTSNLTTALGGHSSLELGSLSHNSAHLAYGTQYFSSTPENNIENDHSSKMSHINHLLDSLESRSEKTFSRLRHLQATQIARHMTEQMAYFVAYEQRRTGVKCQWKIFTQSQNHCNASNSRQQHQSHPKQPHSKHANQPSQTTSSPMKVQIANGMVVPSNASGSHNNKGPKESPSKLDEKRHPVTQEEMKSLSTQELVNLIEKMKKSAASSITLSNGTITASSVQQQQSESTPPLCNGSFSQPPVQSPTTTTPTTGSKKTSSGGSKKNNASGSGAGHSSVAVGHHSQPHAQLTKAIPSIANFTVDQISSLETAVSMIKRDMSHFEKAIDSDATESSSGGESCDEHEDYPLADLSQSNYCTPSLKMTASSPQISSPNTYRSNVPMCKRAVSRWASERSCIATRWSWLQAQVSDLNFRALQQDNWYKSLRMTKGACQFICTTPGIVPLSPNVIRKEVKHQYGGKQNNGNITAEALRALQQNSNANQDNNVTCDTPTTASPEGTPPASDEETGEDEEDDETTLDGEEDTTATQNCSQTGESSNTIVPPCARHLALDRLNFKRRRLVRSSIVLNLTNKRSARLSSISCQCSGISSSPLTINPCVICNGRYNYASSMDTHSMPYMERVSLLDHSTHPILSTPRDVSLGLHFAKLLKKEAQHQRISPKPLSKKKKSINALDKGKGAARTAAHPSLPHSGPLHQHPLKKCIPPSFSSSLKRKLTANSKKVDNRRSSTGAGNAREAEAGRKRTKTLSSSDKNGRDTSPTSDSESSDGWSSPLPSPYDQVHKGPGRRRRSDASAFDIDNIVIPQSIAASTRIEKLEYKEIITPKWRIVPRNSTRSLAPIEEDSDRIKTEVEGVEAKEGISFAGTVTKEANNTSIKCNNTAPPPELKPNGNVANGTSSDNSHLAIDENTMDVDAAVKQEPEEEEEDDEDISDEAFLERHKKCEVAERARLVAYLNNNSQSNVHGKVGRGRNRSSASMSDRTPLSTPLSLPTPEQIKDESDRSEPR